MYELCVKEEKKTKLNSFSNFVGLFLNDNICIYYFVLFDFESYVKVLLTKDCDTLLTTDPVINLKDC